MSEPTGSCTVFRYRGPGWLNGCPARDLLPADLVELAEREGIGVEAIMRSGLYVVEESIEVSPFCGAPVGEGRCRAPVEAWGDRCEAHRGKGPGERSEQ